MITQQKLRHKDPSKEITRKNFTRDLEDRAQLKQN